jgi:hypothetical protein
MRQRSAETLVTEEPYELIAPVRDCGGAGWATTGSTRKPTPTAYARPSLPLPGAAHRGRYPEVMRGEGGEAFDFAFEDTKPMIDDRDLLDDVGAVAARAWCWLRAPCGKRRFKEIPKERRMHSTRVRLLFLDV